eukprot:g40280.t1
MNAIYKFADNTTVVKRVSNNNESKYGREIEGLGTSCNENNLSLNLSKTKELIIDFRKKGGEYAPIYTNRIEVDRVKNSSSSECNNQQPVLDFPHRCVKKAKQRLFFLRQLRKFDMSIESMLSGCTKAQYGNFFAQDHKKILKVMCTAQTITEANLPFMNSIYMARCRGKAANIIKDPSDPVVGEVRAQARGQPGRVRNLSNRVYRILKGKDEQPDVVVHVGTNDIARKRDE